MEALKDVPLRQEASPVGQEISAVIADLGQAVRKIAVAELPVLIGALAQFQAQAQLRMLTGSGTPQPTPLPDQSRYLTVDQVCDRFHVTAKWLYRHKKKLPHSQPSRKVLLFPEARLCQWFERRKAS